MVLVPAAEKPRNAVHADTGGWRCPCRREIVSAGKEGGPAGRGSGGVGNEL